MTMKAEVQPHDGSIETRYRAKTPGSAALAKRARAVLPGGVVTDTRIFDPYGIYIEKAAGTLKWDVDGNEYLDFFGGHGANMLGHAHPLIVEAAGVAMSRGSQYAANHPLEVALAELVTALIPSAELLRFTGSGTEATLLAIRLARAFTGRTRIVRVASHYHGWHDHAASGYDAYYDGSAAPGILPEVAARTLLVRANDEAGLAEAFNRHGGDIAAVIAEPVGTHFGVVPTSAAFLRALQDTARSAGALFILDEVLSGFRVSLGGAQQIFGLSPDLTTLAKVLCGGLPGGAVVGRSDILSRLDADACRRSGHGKVTHQGTFTGNPVSMAAGIAMIEEIKRIDGCAVANRLGERARSRLADMAEAERLPFFFYGDFSACHLLIGDREVALGSLPMEAFLQRPQPLLNRLRIALNVLGVDVNTKCSALFGATHSEADIDVLAHRFAAAGAMLRKEGFLAQ